jgi:nucleoside-diphosphate-sugar epimerase
MRDHIFIDDLVNVISTCIDKCITGSYTVATGKVISFYEIAKIICRIKRISPNKIVFNKREGPMPHNGYRAFDISLLNKNFPNLIFTDMEQGISKSIDYLI